MPENNLGVISDPFLPRVRAIGNRLCPCSQGIDHMDADSGLPGRSALAAPDTEPERGLRTVVGGAVSLKNPASPESSHRHLMGPQQILADCCRLLPLSQPPLCGIHTPSLSAVGVLPRRVSHAVQLGWLLQGSGLSFHRQQPRV